MKRTFLFDDGKSKKFWAIEITGESFTVTYGKAGTAGQTNTKAFASAEECQKQADKLVAEKTKKGYAEEVRSEARADVKTSVRPDGSTETVHTFWRVENEEIKGLVYQFGKNGYELTEFEVMVEGAVFSQAENPEKGDDGVFKIEEMDDAFKVYVYSPAKSGAKRTIQIKYVAKKPIGDLSVLTEDNYSHIAPVVDTEEANTVYNIEEDISYPFLDFEEQDTCLYKGDLKLTGIDAGSAADWNAYNLIVDGNLTVDGDIDWSDYGSGSFLLVTGNLKVRNLIMQGCTNITVRGDVQAENGILGHYGDDGGYFTVHGETKAKVIVNTLYFNMSFANQPNAVVIGDTYRTDCEVDFDDEEDVSNAILPDFLDDDGGCDTGEIATALKSGAPILRPTAVSPKQALANRLAELLQHPEDVTELDLSELRISEIPEEVFEFYNLEKLNLHNTMLKNIEANITKLTKLRELNISNTGIGDLPAEFAKLTSLEKLDIRSAQFEHLPEAVCKMKNLKELRCSKLDGLPEDFIKLQGLEAFVAWNFKYDPDSPGRYNAIFELKSLKKLELHSLPIHDFSNLANLTNLEDLEIIFSDTPSVFPGLSPLKKLKKLELDGYYCSDKEFLQNADIYDLPELEEFTLSRMCDNTKYNAQKKKHEVVCPALSHLPQNAFASMPGLKKIHINSETFVPDESFFCLKHLEEVTFKYTAISTELFEKIKKAYPCGVRVNIPHYKHEDTSSDKNWNEVHNTVKKASELMSKRDYRQACTEFEKALTLCETGLYSEYDRLFACYGICYSLGQLIPHLSGEERQDTIAKYIDVAKTTMEICPHPYEIWIFTAEGSFHREVNRVAANGLAWYLMEGGELAQALEIVGRAVACIDSSEHNFIYDTQVRILLNMGKTDEAYRIVQRILKIDPGFGDFQDINADQEYKKWVMANS